MTVCTFYAQLGKFLGNRKNNEFPGKFIGDYGLKRFEKYDTIFSIAI